MKIDDNRIVEVSKVAKSAAEACRILGIGYDTYKSNAIRLGCYRFKRRCNERISYTLEGLEKGIYHHIGNREIKRILISNGIKEDKCDECGNGPIWNGKPLKIQVHHIDGNCRNNILSNISFLCPNCHSQTDNFSRSNKYEYEVGQSRREFLKLHKHKIETGKREVEKCKNCGCEMRHGSKTGICKRCRSEYAASKRPSKEELESMIHTTSYIEIGRRYNVSNTTVKRWARRYGMKLEKRGTRDFG